MNSNCNSIFTIDSSLNNFTHEQLHNIYETVRIACHSFTLHRSLSLSLSRSLSLCRWLFGVSISLWLFRFFSYFFIFHFDRDCLHHQGSCDWVHNSFWTRLTFVFDLETFGWNTTKTEEERNEKPFYWVDVPFLVGLCVGHRVCCSSFLFISVDHILVEIVLVQWHFSSNHTFIYFYLSFIHRFALSIRFISFSFSFSLFLSLIIFFLISPLTDPHSSIQSSIIGLVAIEAWNVF